MADGLNKQERKIKMAYTKDEIERIKKYHPECLRGAHVPVVATDRHNRILDVYCQNCLVPMTKEEHKLYFIGHKPSVITQINYNEPGDPKDIDTFTTEFEVGNGLH